MAAQLKDFAGRGALVTGAAAGIGLAIARMLATRGAGVALVDLDAEAARAGAAQCEGDAIGLGADVAQEREVAQAFAAARARFGRIDVVINNAGVMRAQGVAIAELDEMDWDVNLDVNLKGVFLGMKHGLAGMLDGRGGAIVNMASAVGLIGGPRAPAYCAAKHGVIGLTRSAAVRHGRDGVRVNAVCPGPVETLMTAQMRASDPALDAEQLRVVPMARRGTPDEIAAATVWLASDGASYVNGVALPVDGGWTAA